MKIEKLVLLSILLLTMRVNAQDITKIELKNVDDRVSEGHQFTISTSGSKTGIAKTENASVTNDIIGTQVGATISGSGEQNAVIIYSNYTVSSSDPDIYLKLDGSSISSSSKVDAQSFVAAIDNSWKLIVNTKESNNITLNYTNNFNITQTKTIDSVL